MTPTEFGEMLEGKLDQEESFMEKLAIHASWVMAPHSKRKIKPEKLYQRKKHTTTTTKQDIQKEREYLQDLAERLAK